jgi:branched-chain amino acid transport system permease protein
LTLSKTLRGSRSWIQIGLLTTVLTLVFGGLFATSASADSVGEDLPYKVIGNVKNEGTPLQGVRIVVSGGGYTAEAITDAEGKWLIGVPEITSYTVSLDQTSLPEGIAVIEDGGAEQTVEMGPSGSVTKNFFIGEGERITVSFIDQFIARIIYGLNFGLMLGLASVGLSLVYGTTGLSNFAHAEMVTFGAIAAFFVSAVLNAPIWLAIPAALVLSGAMGWGLDSGLWKPLRKRSLGLVQLMIVSIGLSLAVRYVFQYFLGGNTEQLPGFDAPKVRVFGATSLSYIDIVSMGLSITVIIGFALWLLFSRTGKATRAISDNSDLAAASGIDVDRVIRQVWVVAAALAGLSGVLWAYFRPGIKWDMGAQILLLIFAAVTLGGLGTAFGALLGAIIVGLLVEVSSLFIPADLKYVGALVVLIVILLVRPQGILGRRERIG